MGAKLNLKPAGPKQSPHRVKVRQMHVIPALIVRDPYCPIHLPDPFNNVLQQHREIEPWEWADPDSVCSCEWEKGEAFERKTAKGVQYERTCQTCHYMRAANGRCEC